MRRRLAEIRDISWSLLVETGARCPADIDPIETAKELGIQVVFGHLTGATARIYRVGGKARIRVSDQIVTPGRRRITIAHEIGHCVLEHELPNEGDEASWLRTCCECRERRHERDADVFGVEHITPEAWVRPYCDVAVVDLHAVHAIARAFTTSPVMAALRLIELSGHACAVVYSENRCVKWMKPSRTFPSYISPGKPLHEGSIADAYFRRGVLEARARTMSTSAWLGSRSRIAQDTEIVEHAELVPEPGWGGVLSLLWIPVPVPQVPTHASEQAHDGAAHPMRL